MIYFCVNAVPPQINSSCITLVLLITEYTTGAVGKPETNMAKNIEKRSSYAPFLYVFALTAMQGSPQRPEVFRSLAIALL